MRIFILVAALVVAGATGPLQVARGAGALQWEAEAVGEESLHLELRDSPPEESPRGVLTVPYENLSGLTLEDVEAGSESVQFRLGRDAGSFTFWGRFVPGRGRGDAEFLPDAGFLQTIRSLGPAPLTPLQLLVLAVHDVKLKELDELAIRGYRNLTFDDLMGMLIHGRGRMAPGLRGLLGMDGLGTDSLVELPR